MRLQRACEICSPFCACPTTLTPVSHEPNPSLNSTGRLVFRRMFLEHMGERKLVAGAGNSQCSHEPDVTGTVVAGTRIGSHSHSGVTATVVAGGCNSRHSHRPPPVQFRLAG